MVVVFIAPSVDSTQSEAFHFTFFGVSTLVAQTLQSFYARIQRPQSAHSHERFDSEFEYFPGLRM